MRRNVSTAICLILSRQKYYVEVRRSGEPERDVYPIFELLKSAGLHQGRIEMPCKEARIGWHLRAVSPRIIANGDNGTACRACEVADGERIGGDMQPHAFHKRNRTHFRHLGTV